MLHLPETYIVKNDRCVLSVGISYFVISLLVCDLGPNCKISFWDFVM